jgi:hypothetical protein
MLALDFNPQVSEPRSHREFEKGVLASIGCAL